MLPVMATEYVGALEIDDDSGNRRVGLVQADANSLHAVLIDERHLLSIGSGRVGELQHQTIGVLGDDHGGNHR